MAFLFQLLTREIQEKGELQRILEEGAVDSTERCECLESDFHLLTLDPVDSNRISRIGFSPFGSRCDGTFSVDYDRCEERWVLRCVERERCEYISGALKQVF